MLRALTWASTEWAVGPVGRYGLESEEQGHEVVVTERLECLPRPV